MTIKNRPDNNNNNNNVIKNNQQTLKESISGETVMRGLKRALSTIKRGLGVLCLGAGLLGFATAAHAVSVSGKVYLDFDNTASLINSPPTLSGISVELLNSSGASLSPAVTGTTTASGDFTLEAPGIGSYRVKAITSTSGEEGIATVAVSGSTPVTGSNVFLKGLGGDLTLNIKDTLAAGVKNIELVVSATDMSNMTKATDASGQVIIRNTLTGSAYTVTVSPADIIADTSNGKNYALWNTTLPNGSSQYVDTFSTTMSGTAQSATFNVRERNEWGADGIVAVDQDENGSYTAGVDTGAAGINVEIYYQGTTTPVLGQSTITTGADGKYNFKNLPLGDFTVKMTNITAPWQLVTADNANFSISTATGNPSAFNFLVNIDSNDTSLPKVSGYVFALASTSVPVAGPDSGQTGNTVPVAASPRLQTTVKLYQHSTTGWSLLATQLSKSDGSYAFKGLMSGKDYKVILDESGINTSAYYFIGDTDGKSSDTSAASLSTHRGKVTLSDSSQDTIAGKEIVLVNVTNARTNQNFWYSTISNTTLYINDYMTTVNNIVSWGGTVNGLAGSSMSAPFQGRYYEEDGVTLARKTDGTLIPTATLGAQPDGYLTVNRTNTPTDHAGYFIFIFDSYDSANVSPSASSSSTPVISYLRVPLASVTNAGPTVYFHALTPNSISGRVYINNSHPGTTGTYNPTAGDIPVYSSRVVLYRKQVSTGIWQTVSNNASDTNGYFKFTNLPNGDYRVTVNRSFGSVSNVTASDVEIEGNIASGATTVSTSTIEVTLTGGTNLTDQDHWYKLTTTDYLITGTTYLDTRSRGTLQIGQPNLENDAPFYGVTVLLCNDGNEADCKIGGANYISHQVTTVNGQFSFSGAADGITSGVDYMVKAIKDGVAVVNSGALQANYKVNFTGLSVPARLTFLLQGNTTFSGDPVNDLDGNRTYLGKNTAENGPGKTNVYYHDGTTWQYWYQTGFYYSDFQILSLPAGKYKVVHVASGSVYKDIADSDPSTEPGTVEFEILADGTFADGLPGTGRNFYQARVYSIAEGVSGQIYLDITGNGVKDDRSIPVPGSELTGVSVKGYFTPRLYPDYTEGEATVLASPDFTDNAVVANNGYFAHTAANASTPGFLYVTNYLLKLDGLDTSKFELVANSGPKQSYLSSAIKSDMSYMQVNGAVSGSPDQYWLIKLKNPTGISGRLYYDLNGNNTYDSGVDAAMSGVRVELWKSGSLYTYTNSGADGSYSFIGLFDDSYDVKVTNTGLDTSLYELVNPGSGVYNGLTVNTISSPTLTDNDFTYKKTGDASISGYVMLDINNNGTIDIDYNKQGDIALGNITVELYKGSVSGSPYKTIQTNSKGYYSFSGIDLSTSYITKVIPTTGYGVINNVDGNASDTLAAITIGATPSSHSNKFFLFAGSSNSNPAAGNGASSATNSGLAGKTLLDDGSSTPLPGVLISLVDSGGVEIARQLTNATGDYHFYNLPSDSYKIVTLSSPSGYALVRNTAGTTPPLDTLSGITVGSSGVTGQNFWYKTASVNGIQGKVYIDFGADNATVTVDSNDHPLSDVTVELYDGTGATGTKLGETTTDETGAYKFENLIYGTGVNYSVKIVMSTLTDYTFALSKAGSTSTAVVIDVANLPQAGVLDNDYFVVGKLKIDGDVWIDADGDLVQGTSELLDGVTVNLNYKAPGASNYSLLKSMTTGTSPATTGQYVFSSLPAGTDYQVVVDSTSTALAGTSLIASSGTGSIADNTDTFTFAALAADNTGSSTAYRYNGSVSGQFIIDVDGNNAYVSGADDAFAGVDVTLSATINSVLVTKTATTDTDGKFSFDNLPIGNWSLTTAATQTVANWSDYTLGFVKSSAGTTVTGTSGLPLSVAITATDTTFTGIEAGYKGSAKISGYIVIDMDPSDGGNAVTGTDTPVASATVTLGSATAGFVSRTTTTDASGYYEFTGLSAHTYKVTVDTSSSTDFAGHVVSFDPLGTTVSTVDLAVATPATVLSTQDFGYKSNGSLAGYIYRDLGGEGTRHAAVDDKMAGVRVKATQGSLIRYSNVTVADGEYKIENLPSGLWTVELDTATLPANISYSYITDLFGETATVVVNGAEVEINPTAAARAAVRGATVSFGVRAAASISGQVVIDVDDQDPLPPAAATVTASDIAIDTTGFYPGYSVNLYVGSTLVSTQAVSSGAYSFTGLSDGVAYIVEVLSPASDYINSFATESTDSGVTAGAVVNTAAKMSRTYTLAATATSATDSHFGWKGAGGISGNVFWDADDNGSYSSSVDSDVGSALTVTLTHGSGSVPAVSRTIASGSTDYSATGLLPGSWTVTVTGVPSTFKASFDPDNAFSATSLVPNADKDKATITVGGSTLTNQHFGYVQGGVLSGVVLHDANATGSFDPSSDGVEVVELSLLDMTHSPVLDSSGNAITITTSSSGEFSLRNLDPSVDYKLQTRFGSAANSGCRLAEMEPSYDSEVGAVSLSSPVSSTVDVTAETHTVVAAISSAPNNEIASTDLHFGYRAAGGDLTIHKTVLKDNVVVGDIVPYTITIENNKATTAFNVTIKDLIPAGFKYVDGSARLDGVKIADPTGARPVYFGPMDIGGSGAVSGVPSKRTLSYMLVVGAGVTQGEYTNVATALDRTGNTASNTSQATVTVTSDPLFNDALIFGKVYVDRNGNGVQDAGEEGIGGVKLVTARGEIITTDSQGRYHLTGVDGGRWERGTNFVLKLDPRSLPEGYRVKGRNPQVVRLSPGLPSKIDFKVEEK
ncbi:SdrD B-like domain-containing protein [Zophobihabitans entericus]|uniref:DUF11 domain-containing protein n=1 Tax=Zophobihabitans entericus TaxID=1635327 RepID=A0A6G9IBR9_9GAMM|nr:SdrD B-like domain-containing protein [Zophobihabitans entericus]QIQ21678.1 DUF11 domain-containing protein [Zophobihabitans entericus]